jgi:hypothetical protein
MKLSTPRVAVHFAASAEEAAQIVLFLHGQGFSARPDENVRPRITVSGISQEALNELCGTWARRCFEAKLAREKREGAR